MIKAILKPFEFIFKTIKSVVKSPLNLVKFILDKVLAVIKYILNLVWKIAKEVYKPFEWIYKELIKLIKYIWAWLVKAFIETLNQLWTLLGMFAAWLVLEGSAKTIVGYSIILVLLVWLVTMGIREGGEE